VGQIDDLTAGVGVSYLTPDIMVKYRKSK